jgi:hypothetical protein
MLQNAHHCKQHTKVFVTFQFDAKCFKILFQSAKKAQKNNENMFKLSTNVK